MFRLVNLIRRSYVRPRDIPIWKHDMMIGMVPNFLNCHEHLEFLKANEGQIPPAVLCRLMLQITENNLLLDEHWPDICKHVKSIILEYSRAVTTDLCTVARCMGDLGEANAEFWEIIENKLIKEGQCRYLSESEAAGLMLALCKVGKGSDELWKRLETEVSKFYLSLDNEELSEAIYALEVSGKGDKFTIMKLKSRLKATELIVAA